MSKIFLAIFSVYTDFQTTCLCITKVGAASYLKVFLLSWRPCFNIQGFHFQVCQVTRAAFQCTIRLKEGNTIYRFTASFDGMHTLPEKAVKLIDSEGSV